MILDPKETKLEMHALSRAYHQLECEVGPVKTALNLYELVRPLYGVERANWLLLSYGELFPILSGMANEKSSERICNRIDSLVDQLQLPLEGKSDIVCIGAEAALLDVIVDAYPDKEYHIVPHSRLIDAERFLSNYRGNVSILDSLDLSNLYGSSSSIITFGFNVTTNSFYTFPSVFRVCGGDTRQYFADIIVLDLLDSHLRFIPKEFVEMEATDVTHVYSSLIPSNERRAKWISAE